MGNHLFLTRREALRLGLLSSGALVLVACGREGAPGVTTTTTPANGQPNGQLTGTIETWSPDTRDDGLASERWWGEAFTQVNPDVTVQQLTVPYGDDTTKFRAGHASDLVPDTIWAYGDLLFSYGIEGMALPVTDLVSEIGRHRFLEGAIQGIEVDGQLYSVPFVGFPFFIYYRKDLYEEKGLTPPTTHEELIANISATHDPPGVYGYVLTNKSLDDTWNLKTAMWTHGAYYFDENDNLALDRPETLEAWSFYKELGRWSPPGSMAQSDLESRQLMLDGTVAHMFTTTSFAAGFTPENIDRYGAFLFPSKPGAKGASLDFYGLVIPSKAKRPDLARAMIKFLLEPANFQEYLARTVVGWVPMLGDAYTDEYLGNPRIELVREFIDLGGQSAETGVVGTGYFGPSPKAAALVATDVEKQIGDRLVVLDETPEQVLAFAIETIEAAL